MKTEVFPVDPHRPDPETISRAAAIVRAGGLVAFPTETVYGLGANGLDATAARRLFVAKGRPTDNPFILHVASLEEVWSLVDSSCLDSSCPRSLVSKLAQRFWPGPLTLVLPRAAHVPPEVAAGLSTVGIRMPAHPVALAFIRAAGVPLAGPSANASGRPSPTTAAHVLADLDGRIEAVLDAGPTGVGVESTVLDVGRTPPVILRPGGVTREMLAAVLGKVVEAPPHRGKGPADEGPALSPGTKYRHYAPSAPLLLARELPPRGMEMLLQEGGRWEARGFRVGALLAEEEGGDVPPTWVVRTVGRRADLAEVAAGLFAGMRELEDKGVDVILALPYPEEGLGRAIMNRLRKAASGEIPGGGEEGAGSGGVTRGGEKGGGEFGGTSS